jgi:DDE superfamily endonuclease
VNRDVWSALEGARLLLLLLVSRRAPSGPLVMGLDDTLERRRGVQIHAKGTYRDPVRSSHRHLVKASGLRWLSLRLLVPMAWAKRVWALPCLTVLAPSERYHQARDLRHKKLTDWARQMLLMGRRWVPERTLVLVTDRRVAVITLLWRVCQLAQEHVLPVRQAAWSRKSRPTVVDAMAIVRRHLWTSTHFDMSPVKADMVEIPCTLLNRLTETLCDAA